MKNNPTLRKVGLRVYIAGTGAKTYAEPASGCIRLRVDSKTLTLQQRLDAIEKARQTLIRLNGGREPESMQDVINLL